MKNTFEKLSNYVDDYLKSVKTPELFWEEQACHFQWNKKWSKVVEWDFQKPDIQWFLNGKLNITENCLDRHIKTHPEQVAIIWEPNDPHSQVKKVTYKELYERVCQVANMLKSHGVKKGDRVCIYMPMIVELAYSVLACARIGAVHSVVFAGFSTHALADRINDAKAKVVITSDGAFRGNKIIALKDVVDKSLKHCDLVEKVFVYKRTGEKINMSVGRDVWWHEEINKYAKECSAEIMDSEDMLFILYTSGSTGSPKGMVHTCGGYMVYTAYTFQKVFQYRTGDIYWCTADIGWITGHSYILYGPLLSGATTLMFEGVPSYPDMGRFWQIIEKYKVSIFYTAPTAIRTLQKAGNHIPQKYDLTSLNVLGTVGEPINEEAWNWYNQYIGHNRCPIVDTYWQTETGGIIITTTAGVIPSKPAHAGLPLPGIQPVILNKKGEVIENNEEEGSLSITFPWPGIARTIYGDHQRFKETYFSKFKNKYFTGDGAKRNTEGYYRITGRVDDVIVTSGHNLSTAEIENVIATHECVCEVAVVGYPHKVKGNAIYAYVLCFSLPKEEKKVREEILQLVSNTVGPIAKPEKIQFVEALPKTRSGKIMRRILRKIAQGDLKNLGDTSTLLAPLDVENIIKTRIV